MVLSLAACSDPLASEASSSSSLPGSDLRVQITGFGATDPSDSSAAYEAAILQAQSWALLAAGARLVDDLEGGTRQLATTGVLSSLKPDRVLVAREGTVVVLEARVRSHFRLSGKATRTLRRTCSARELGESVQQGIIELVGSSATASGMVVRIAGMDARQTKQDGEVLCTFELTLHESP